MLIHHTFKRDFGPVDAIPTWVAGAVSVSNIQQTTVDLSWSGATDDNAVTGYKIYQDATEIADVAGTTYTATGLTANTSYTFAVQAYDVLNQLSIDGPSINTLTQGAADVIAPTWPATTVITDVAGGANSERVLTWTAANDNVGVAGYRVYKNQALLIDIGNTLTYTLTGLGLDIDEYTIRAYDAADNESDPASADAPAILASAASEDIIDGEQMFDGFTWPSGLSVTTTHAGYGFGNSGVSGRAEFRATTAQSTTITETFNRPVRSVAIEMANHKWLASSVFSRQERLHQFEVDGVDFQPSVISPTAYGLRNDGWGPASVQVDGANWEVYPTSTNPAGGTVANSTGYVLVFNNGGTPFSSFNYTFDVFQLNGADSGTSERMYVFSMKVIE